LANLKEEGNINPEKKTYGNYLLTKVLFCANLLTKVLSMPDIKGKEVRE